MGILGAAAQKKRLERGKVAPSCSFHYSEMLL